MKIMVRVLLILHALITAAQADRAHVEQFGDIYGHAPSGFALLRDPGFVAYLPVHRSPQ